MSDSRLHITVPVTKTHRTNYGVFKPRKVTFLPVLPGALPVGSPEAAAAIERVRLESKNWRRSGWNDSFKRAPKQPDFWI